MSWKRRVIHLLDRPGGRGLLGSIASRTAVRVTGADVGIGHDRIWYHRVGRWKIPDGPRFGYYPVKFHDWLGEPEAMLGNAREWWLRHWQPKPGDVIVDVGAGRGEDVPAFAEAVGPSGRVIAIEAHPRSCEMLAHFVRLNEMANVTPVNVAILDQPGTVTIEDTDAWVENAIVASGPGFQVQAARLKEICDEHRLDRIDFLKMNIEGAERFALPGLEDVLDRVGTVCVACHDFRADRGHGEQYRTRAFVEDFLTRHGFQVRSRADHPDDYVRDHVFGIR